MTTAETAARHHLAAVGLAASTEQTLTDDEGRMWWRASEHHAWQELRAAPAYMPPQEAPADDPDPPPSPVASTPASADDTSGPHLRDRLLRRAELKHLPRPAPLIAETLDQRTVALLSGRSSTGKSFVAIDWGCCIATGKPWQGREVLETGPVLYIAAEGAFGLDQRLSAWEQAWHRGAERFVTLPEPVNLFTGAGFGQLVDVVREGLDGEPWRLVVFDTWARSTVGGQENNNSDSTTAFARVDQVRQLGPTALVIAHTDGGDNKTRGATALEDNADTVYRIKGDAGYLELERTKRKDGQRDDRHQLQLLTLQVGVDLFSDAPITSCVVQNTRGQDHVLTDKARALLSVFDECFADMGCSKAELRNAADMPPATFARSLKVLVQQDILVNTGTDTRTNYKAGSAHE